MKNKILSMLLVCMTISLMGCGDNNTVTNDGQVSNAVSQNEVTQTDIKPDENSDNVDVNDDGADIIEPDEQSLIQQITTKTDDEVIDTDNTVNDIEVKTDFTNISSLIDKLDTKGDNTVLSDTSLRLCLGLAGAGADGDTKKEIEEYLGYSMDNFILHSKNMNDKYKSYSDDMKIYTANSIWGNMEFVFNKNYCDIISNQFNGAVNTLDFDDPESANVINKWVSDNTEGCIKEIVNSGEMVNLDAVLINSLYFNGTWEEPFEEQDVIEGEFHNDDGSVTNVDMMNAEVDTYYENDNAIGFSKRYSNGISFIGVLPKVEGDFSTLDLDINSLIDSKNYSYNVSIKMPKFKIEDRNSLIQGLSETGLKNTMGDSPDFSGISDTPLIISDVIQKTYIDVNEKGTEAAAVTGMLEFSAALNDEEKTVVLDRPFVFLIYDNINNECLFIGKINKL